MSKKIFALFAALIAAALVLGACVSGNGAEESPAADANTIATAVAMTVEAQSSAIPLTAEPNLTSIPTSILLPPTATLAPTSTATVQPSNAWGWAEEWVTVDGAWTASQGFQSCINDPVCWELTGDTQYKIWQSTATIDCDANNSVLVAAWDGDYEWNGGELHVEGIDEVGQFVLFICPPDENLPIHARVNAGFALVTDLPARQVRQGYLDQNIETMFGPDNCDGDGCDDAVILTIVETVSGKSLKGRVEKPYGAWLYEIP